MKTVKIATFTILAIFCAYTAPAQSRKVVTHKVQTGSIESNVRIVKLKMGAAKALEYGYCHNYPYPLIDPTKFEYCKILDKQVKKELGLENH
jgi:hypothetical protein